MSEAQRRARHAQQVAQLCEGVLRAFSGEADLHFRGRRLHRGREPLPWFAPHLHPSLDSDDFGSFRGTADGLALRLTRSDAALHARLCPQEPVARMVFEMLEQYRVESLVPPGMIGMARNLRHRHVQCSLRFHHAGLTTPRTGCCSMPWRRSAAPAPGWLARPPGRSLAG